jgi:anti-sigma factor RsiW
MGSHNEILHRLLDGDLSEDEKPALNRLLESDPLVSREYELLLGVVRIVEDAEKAAVPEGFKSSVMRRLQTKKRQPRKRPGDLFFGDGALRWDLVSTLAAAFFLIISVAAFIHMKSDSGPVEKMSASSDVVRTVRISLFAPYAKSVAIAGDFNRWSEDAAMMKNVNGSWTIEVPLKPGVYQYMFVVDGQGWVSDPGAEAYRDDGFGNRNAVMRVNEI